MGEMLNMELRTVEHSMPLNILSDLISRFIINVPEAAKENLIRICFQIELAYWYYLDFYVNNDANLKGCAFKEFAAHVFQHLPNLKQHTPRLGEILEEWRNYKQSVPTYGAILVSEGNSHVLLVQSYWAKTSWGFPKGKVNEAEDPAHCAIREVYEETGFDISSRLDPEYFFEAIINEQLVRLYVIQDIPRDTKFAPRTRYEIRDCKWFSIADLPNNKKDNTPKVKMGYNPNSFFMVLPFVKRIKGIYQNSHHQNVQQSNKQTRRQRTKSCSSFSENEAAPSVVQKSKVYVRQRSETDDHKRAMNNNYNKQNHCTKRQLFGTEKEITFSAPSWLNFKFDKAAILECIP